jgi:two-component system sensor histidine kinase KdpD
VDVPRELPAAMADPAIMERVIVNLAVNALRYSPAGSPPLLTASALGDCVELRVADRGPGVPEASRDQMFAPFQRLGDTGSTTGPTGVGLGLALSRGLTEAMSGTLEAEETHGGGLTMVVTLPAVARPASPGGWRQLPASIRPRVSALASGDSASVTIRFMTSQWASTSAGRSR